MKSSTEHKKRIIIVPGLAESAAHFKKMKRLLEKKGFAVTVVPSWNTENLTQSSADIFVGHSLGANVLLHKKLTPALLVGAPDRSKMKSSFMRSLLAADLHAVKTKKIIGHIRHRIHNAATLLLHFEKFYRLAREFKNIDFFNYAPDSSIILVQNTSDHIVHTTKHARIKPGTHEDLVLHPEQYISYIEELAQL